MAPAKDANILQSSFARSFVKVKFEDTKHTKKIKKKMARRTIKKAGGRTHTSARLLKRRLQESAPFLINQVFSKKKNKTPELPFFHCW